MPRNPKRAWSSVQCLPQQQPRAMQLRLASTRGDTEHLRDLLMLVSLDVVEHEHLSSPRRKSRDRRVEVECHSWRPPARSRVRERIDLVGLGAKPRTVPAFAL